MLQHRIEEQSQEDMSERLQQLENVLHQVRTLLPGRQHIDMESRALQWAEYDRRRRNLLVRFQSGAEYEYGSVEPQRWREMLGSDSRGRYFVREIRNNYPFRKVS